MTIDTFISSLLKRFTPAEEVNWEEIIQVFLEVQQGESFRTEITPEEEEETEYVFPPAGILDFEARKLQLNCKKKFVSKKEEQITNNEEDPDILKFRERKKNALVYEET